MSCEGLVGKLGYHCREVRANVVAVDTPFTFIDGATISFYLDETGQSVVMSDNADTLAHMASLGWEPGDRRSWKSVKQLVSTFGFELTDTGEIRGYAATDQESRLITRYVSAMVAVSDLERDILGFTEELDQFIEEVEAKLRAWKPKKELIHLPSVQGHSGRVHRFHFDFDEKLIDAVRPHSGRTGSILRKAADVLNTGIQREIMVVMDDREDEERAAVESDILNTMVRVMPFTRLDENSRGTLLQ